MATVGDPRLFTVYQIARVLGRIIMKYDNNIWRERRKYREVSAIDSAVILYLNNLS